MPRYPTPSAAPGGEVPPGASRRGFRRKRLVVALSSMVTALAVTIGALFARWWTDAVVSPVVTRRAHPGHADHARHQGHGRGAAHGGGGPGSRAPPEAGTPSGRLASG